MKKSKRYLVLTAVILSITILAGCSGGSGIVDGNLSTSIVSGTNIQITTDTDAAVVEFEEDDYYFDWTSAAHTTITLNGDCAASDGNGATVSSAVVTIHAPGIYEITGTLTDGSIVVDTADKETVILVLNNAEITSQTSAPIYIKDAGKTVILLEPETDNSVHGGSGCMVDAEEEPSAAIFSKSDLTIGGSGTLTVTADYNDGITCKDVFKITDGTLVVTAVSDGLVGKDSLNIEKAFITITAGKDGMRSTNNTDASLGNVMIADGEFTITAACDAITAENTLQIADGTFNLSSGGGYPGKSINTGNENNTAPGGGMKPGGKTGGSTATTTTSAEISKKGLKAGQNLIINGGDITISSYDDAIHSNLDVTINNAVLLIETGDDGIHAENDVVVNSGDITIKNAYEGIEGTNVSLNNGTYYICTTDDGVNINSDSGVFAINGGEVSINANGDGLDSNGTIVMTGGTVYVDGPVNDGNGSIDYNSDFRISGGTLVASGSSGMAQAPSEKSSQASILMYYSSIQTAGTVLTVKDSSGSVVTIFTPTKQYSSVAISSPLFEIGSTYVLYKNGTEVTSFEITGTLTYLGESGTTTRAGF